MWLVISIFISLPIHANSIYQFKIKTLEGKSLDFTKFRKQVLVIANTASRCGYTDQYGSLEKLYKKFKKQGVMVVGFPSNSFKQELKEDTKIASFCKKNYGVTFPLARKSAVKGSQVNPVFKYLTSTAPHDNKGSAVAWNFEKFITDRNGVVKYRFRSSIDPLSPEFIKALKSVL